MGCICYEYRDAVMTNVGEEFGMDDRWGRTEESEERSPIREETKACHHEADSRGGFGNLL
jgi:2-hydroxychromene-2-carboxylate isomerase